MQKYQSIVSGVLFVLLIFLSQGIVQAQELPPELPPAMPSCFYGTVEVNGEPAAIGSEISAWMNGEEKASTTVEYFEGFHVYALKISSDGSFVEGADIEFRLDDQHIAEQKNEVWQPGTNIEVNLNFLFSGEDPHQIFLPLVLH